MIRDNEKEQLRWWNQLDDLIYDLINKDCGEMEFCGIGAKKVQEGRRAGHDKEVIQHQRNLKQKQKILCSGNEWRSK